MGWTEEREAWLRNLVVSPEQMSASQIGAVMGISRNAVIGKVKRLELTLPNPRFVHNAPRKPRAAKGRTTGLGFAARARARLSTGDGPERINLPKEQISAPVTLLAAQKHHCRWPVSEDDAPLFLFCGAVKGEGSYCWRHAAMSVSGYRRTQTMVAAE